MRTTELLRRLLKVDMMIHEIERRIAHVRHELDAAPFGDEVSYLPSVMELEEALRIAQACIPPRKTVV